MWIILCKSGRCDPEFWIPLLFAAGCAFLSVCYFSSSIDGARFWPARFDRVLSPIAGLLCAVACVVMVCLAIRAL